MSDHDESGRKVTTLAEVIAKAESEYPGVPAEELAVVWEWCCTFPSHSGACNKSHITVVRKSSLEVIKS